MSPTLKSTGGVSLWGKIWGGRGLNTEFIETHWQQNAE